MSCIKEALTIHNEECPKIMYTVYAFYAHVTISLNTFLHLGTLPCSTVEFSEPVEFRIQWAALVKDLPI